MSSPWGAADRSRRTRSCSARRFLDRFIDSGVARTAAEIAADRRSDLGARRSGRRIEERLRGHEHSGCAVAALRRALFRERDLQRVKRLAGRKALDRRHVGVAHESGKGQAGEDRNAIDKDGARPALAELASMLRAGEAELLAKDLEERVVRIRRDRSRLAVHAKGEELLRHAASAPMRCETARAAETQRSPMRRSVRRSTRSLKPTTITTATRRSDLSTIGAATARTPAKSSWSSYPTSARPARTFPCAPLSRGSRRPSGAVMCRSVAGSARAAISSLPSTTIPRIAVSPKLSISETRYGCASERRSGADALASVRSSGPSRKRVSGSRTTKPNCARVRSTSRSVPFETSRDRASSLMPIGRPPSARARKTRAALSTAGTGRSTVVLSAIRVRLIVQRG